MDSQAKKIVNLSLNGEYLSKFTLYQINVNPDFKLVKNPLCMKSIDNCNLAININREKILIYNLNGDIDHIIEFEYEIGAFFYSNGFLFIHQYNGTLACYKKNENNEWFRMFERFVDFNDSWSATDFTKWNTNISVI